MGCDDYPHILDNKYRLGDTVAELWNHKLALRFPHASHATCFQALHIVAGQVSPQPYVPARCQDWHCPKCGAATNMYGHISCGGDA